MAQCPPKYATAASATSQRYVFLLTSRISGPYLNCIGLYQAPGTVLKHEAVKGALSNHCIGLRVSPAHDKR
jgi:hypothetical protein